jgi:hypothetical protein
MALARRDGLFSDSSCRAIGSSGDALAGDREPCRGCEAALWLVTGSLAGEDGDNVSTSFASHTRFDLPRTFDTSSSISVGTSPAESVWTSL